MMQAFFISHNRADSDWAEWIAWLLEEAGYSTVLDAWDFKVGSNFVLEMDAVMKKAVSTIAVLSPEYLSSPYAQSEWATAFAKDPLSVKQALMPIRVRPCEVQGLLGPLIYLDLVGLDEATSKKRILTHIRGVRAKPSQSPKFPGVRSTTMHQPAFPGTSLPPKSGASFECGSPQEMNSIEGRRSVWDQLSSIFVAKSKEIGLEGPTAAKALKPETTGSHLKNSFHKEASYLFA